ncbi:emerin homolog 1-like isoform X2 [Limulus polyphemus]|nr:emerin homolog 1-like isoform X2 [Limulus polyphemus]XP_013778065.1 emerin homolog 1-like isoform X2 [Limulus polyphemus]XP_022245691.1 emerin homolog 1-like isoform X2 [Limulus polyphemus]XP_022245692.1 emerin homolog 1-like isoform X2 [Limulus polyphemus]XP_022245694.1 emerin homolog 1-like isoform X2 [Limulus polyphemus]
MPNLIVDGINISELTDQQLFMSLRNAGVDVGPITGSTRAVYERKLARILQGESYSDDPFENEFDENQCSITDERAWTSIIQVTHRRPVSSTDSPQSVDHHSSPVYGQKRLDDDDGFASGNLRSIQNVEQPSSTRSQLVFLCFSMKTVIIAAVLIVIVLLYLNA